MKTLNIFQLRGMSRGVIDSYMVDNDYKIYDIDFNEKIPSLSEVTYKHNGILDLRIKVSYNNNIVYNIIFC